MNAVRAGFTKNPFFLVVLAVIRICDDCAVLKEKQAFSRPGKELPPRENNVNKGQKTGRLREHGLFEAPSFLP